MSLLAFAALALASVFVNRWCAKRFAAVADARVAAAAAKAQEEAAGVKAMFLANMSHEIRTPMTAIQGYADLLLDPSLGDADRRRYAETIRRNSEHLLAVLSDILDLSRIDADRMRIHVAPCSPAQIASDVVGVLRVRAREKSLALNVVFSTPIPETIQTDATRLRQILMNLVGNAIKFTQSGSVRVYVRCEGADTEAPTLAFEVADTGIGMTRAQMDKLFAPFSQGDASSTRLYGGAGLGLSICKRLSHALGGDVTAESLLGRGSSFTVILPTGPLAGITMLRNLRDTATVVEPPSSGQAVVSLSANVLLAEDGPDNQVLIATQLRRAGATVTVAENGRIAFEAALEAQRVGRPFDVILMDMQMPELDGYGATRALRAEGYQGTIVALTAHALDGDREACLAAGCDEYLTKPIHRSKLLGTVRRFTERELDPIESADTMMIQVAKIHEAPLVSELADDPDIADLVVEFLGVLGERAKALADARASGDMETVRRVVHQLKGAAGGYGFPTITEQAREVERALAADDAAAFLRGVDALCALCRRAATPAASATSSAA